MLGAPAARRTLCHGVVDSGAYRHMTSELADFGGTMTPFSSPLHIGGICVHALGKGQVTWKVQDAQGRSRILQLQEVLYIPELAERTSFHTRLISAGRGVNDGFELHMGAVPYLLLQSRQTGQPPRFIPLPMSNGIPILPLQPVGPLLPRPTVLAPGRAALPDLWHARLGEPPDDWGGLPGSTATGQLPVCNPVFQGVRAPIEAGPALRKSTQPTVADSSAVPSPAEECSAVQQTGECSVDEVCVPAAATALSCVVLPVAADAAVGAGMPDAAPIPSCAGLPAATPIPSCAGLPATAAPAGCQLQPLHLPGPGPPVRDADGEPLVCLYADAWGGTLQPTVAAVQCSGSRQRCSSSIYEHCEPRRARWQTAFCSVEVPCCEGAGHQLQDSGPYLLTVSCDGSRRPYQGSPSPSLR
jgi:hypothetical protein